jgi:hypothetical protein
MTVPKGWLNTKKIIAPKVAKPCKKLGYCPYGQLVEEFPVRKKRSKYSCHIFGHDCPVHYHMEKI